MPLTALRMTQQSLLYYDENKIERYADLMQKGCVFPPIEVSNDGGGVYTVWQGHHRVQASRRCSFTHIPFRTAMASEEPVADFKCRRLGAASV